MIMHLNRVSKGLLTMCSWCRMGSGEHRLSLTTLSLKRCEDRSNLITRFGIIVNFLLKVLEDLGINHSCYAGVGHFDVGIVILRGFTVAWRCWPFPFDAPTLDFENFDFGLKKGIGIEGHSRNRLHWCFRGIWLM